MKTMINNLSIEAYAKYQTFKMTNRAGQGLVEYALILGVVLVVAAVFGTELGDGIKAKLGKVKAELMK